MHPMSSEDFAAMLAEFKRDRDAALLSLDKAQLLAYADKWGVEELKKMKDEATFWAAIHMARTGAKSLPVAERVKSKRWLKERNLRSLDDGDLPDLSL